MRDLWNDLARRARVAPSDLAEAPFGFANSVVQKVQAARRDGSSLLDDWVAVLRPALGLAVGTAEHRDVA